jgi:hypothetical protein
MPAGTSVVGTELLDSDLASTTRMFLLLVSRNATDPPRRVGFYWIEVYVRTSPEVGYIIASGPVYAGGFRIVTPVFGLNSDDRHRWWVDWNESGLDWQAISGVAP